MKSDSASKLFISWFNTPVCISLHFLFKKKKTIKKNNFNNQFWKKSDDNKRENTKQQDFELFEFF